MSRNLNIALKAFVCLFVIGTMVLIIPLFQNLKRNMKTESCQSNLKQMGLAFIEYDQENDGAMPNISRGSTHTTWRQAIFPYVKASIVYHCPDRGDSLNIIGSDGLSQDYAANYTGNYGKTQPDKGNGAFAGPDSKPISTAEFNNSSMTFVLVEAESNNRPEFNIDNAKLFSPNAHKLWAGELSGRNYVWEKQYAGGNYLMADGHVKWLRPEETYQTDKHGKVLHNYWYRDIHKPLSANGVAVLKAAN